MVDVLLNVTVSGLHTTDELGVKLTKGVAYTLISGMEKVSLHPAGVLATIYG